MPIKLGKITIPSFKEFTESKTLYVDFEQKKEKAALADQPVIPAPAKFLDWKESIQKLEEIGQKLRAAICQKKPADVLPTTALLAAIAAETEVLRKLNDEKINCPVPWDEESGFPSPPSMAADAAKLGDLLEIDSSLEAILDSFSGWTMLSRQKIPCCCGRANTSLEEIEISVMLNHSVKISGTDIFVGQIAGIKSSNQKHLAHHYSGFGYKSQKYDDIYVRWRCENQIDSRSFDISLNTVECSAEFDASEFENRISKAYDYFRNFEPFDKARGK